MKEYPISASQVKKWKTCPRQFWYRYISDHDEDSSNKYTEMGSAVHESIEDYLKAGNPIDDEEEILDGLKIELAKREEDFDYDEDMAEKARTCLESAAKYLEMLDEEIEGVEKDIEFEHDEPGIDRDFRAIMDLATENKIVDWKTGNQGPEEVQAGIYIEGYKDEYGEPPEEVHFVYLKDGDVNIHKAVQDEETYWSETENQYWDDMLVHAQAMINAMEIDNFPADPGEDKCYWCAYSYHCPESGVGVGDIPWDAFR